MPQDRRGSVLIGSALDLPRSLAGCSPWGRESRAQLSSLTTAAQLPKQQQQQFHILRASALWE